MPELNFDGITVKFPFNPYQVQSDYMKTVIECLEGKQNAILESPTSTGKTLCLLCATLGWVESRFATKNNSDVFNETFLKTDLNSSDEINVDEDYESNVPPTVIYASRTHSQIAQAMKELKRTDYNYMPTAVYASRNQLCVHPALKDKSNSDKSRLCKLKVKAKACIFHKKVDAAAQSPDAAESILDVEDLGRIGLKYGCCSFYLGMERMHGAKVIFMPYNYLIDPKIRAANQISLKNAIIILDEAHNVEQVCQDSACSKITSSSVRIAMRDMKYIKNQVSIEDLEHHDLLRRDVHQLGSAFYQLNNAISNIPLSENGSHPGGYVFKLLEKANITKHNYEAYTLALDKFINLLFQKSRECRTIGLQAILNFLEIAFSSSAEKLKDSVDRCYKVFIQDEPPEEGQTQTNGSKIVNLWCFSPEFAMQHIMQQNIWSLILTSGTLAPIKPIITEMKVNFPLTLSNRHIIQDFQVFAQVIGYGSDKKLLNSSFQNRDNPLYLNSLGNSIVEIATVVPDGLLIFFPSYGLMYDCKRSWQNNGTWSKLEQIKPILIEPKTKNEFKMAISNYYTNINAKKGAIFMAVLRGKVSEGVDFADMYGRAVIVVGIPYSPCKDPKVVLKQKYLDHNRTTENEMLSGREWYTLEAIRAVNQAIGRVIRHKDDYGAILLCDNRFNYKKENISKWIQTHLNGTKSAGHSFHSTMSRLRNFFITAQQRLPIPKPNINFEVNLNDDDTLPTSIQTALELSNTVLAESEDDGVLIDEDILTSDDNDDDDNDDDDFECFALRLEPVAFVPESDSVSNLVNLHERKRKLDGNSSRISNEGISPQPSTSRITETNNNLNELKRARTENPMLRFLQDDLGSERYDRVLHAFDNYEADDDYSAYKDSLFSIFDERHLIELLRSMSLCFKREHRTLFQNDVDNFMKLQQ